MSNVIDMKTFKAKKISSEKPLLPKSVETYTPQADQDSLLRIKAALIKINNLMDELKLKALTL